MNELEQHFKKETEQIRMTSAEKTAMRLRLRQEMGVVAEPAGGTSMPARPTQSPYVWMFAPRSLAMLSVALLVILSTGSAYAAEGSLPGAPLYSVKTKVLEPLKVALAPTTQAKAEVNAKIAAVRVQEAQALAAQGTLTPEVVEQISTSYNEHAQAALALADSFEAEGDAEDSTSTTSTTVSDDASDQKPVVAAAPAPSPTLLRKAEPGSTDSSGSEDADEGDHEDVSGSDATRSTSTSFTVMTVTTTGETSSTTKATSAPTRPASFKNVPSTSAQPNPTSGPSNVQNQSDVRTTQSASSTAKVRAGFVRQLRESLDEQARILQDLDAQVRVGKNAKGSKDDQ